MTNVLTFPSPAPAPKPVQLPSLSAKDTAAAIRAELRAAFPACVFRVVTERGSMVSSVRIRWTDGPTLQRVEAIVAKYEAGHFDGMQDMYVPDPEAVVEVGGTRFRPTCKYVFCTRDSSPQAYARAARAVLGYWQMGEEEHAQGVALVRAIEEAPDAEAARVALDAYHAGARRVYVSGAWKQLDELVSIALHDRTTCTFTHSEG